MLKPWWRHQMEKFSEFLLAICAGNSPVPGEFPAQRPVTRSFDVFFDLRLDKRLSKQLWGWWFETLSCPLWRHCNASTEWWSFFRQHLKMHFLHFCSHFTSLFLGIELAILATNLFWLSLQGSPFPTARRPRTSKTTSRASGFKQISLLYFIEADRRILKFLKSGKWWFWE